MQRRLIAGCASAVLCAAVLAGAQHLAAPAVSRQVREVYFDEGVVPFRAERDSLITRSFEVGGWHFGRRMNTKPHDGRLNLYVLSPGEQYAANSPTGYGFNCIVNALPKGGAEVEWDVYWAVVLDPGATNEIRSERDLLLGAQAEFAPGNDYTLEQAPGHELLRRSLRITTVTGLDRYRRTSGQLPRIMIVPANIVLKAATGEPAPGPQ